MRCCPVRLIVVGIALFVYVMNWGNRLFTNGTMPDFSENGYKRFQGLTDNFISNSTLRMYLGNNSKLCEKIAELVFLYYTSMFSDEYEIVHIPDKQAISPKQQATVKVLASLIDPKFANAMVRKLNQVAQLENLRHVKRVRKKCLDDGKIQLSVLLCLASDIEGDLSDIPRDVADLINSYQLSTFVTQVCKYAATTKTEWEEQCKLWPTSYHPPTYNIEGIAGFRDECSKTIFSFMQHAINLATAGKEVVNAAIIVDPSVNQVIATACDDIGSLHTSPNGNGAEKDTFSLEHSEALTSEYSANGCSSKKLQSTYLGNDFINSYTDVQCLNPWQWSQRSLSATNSCCWHPLRHAALVAIEKSAARDRTLFPGTDNIGENLTQADLLATCSPAKRMRVSSNGADNEEISNDAVHSDSVRPYLCTGFDIYLAWEPCVMCAMALVHQRIGRIFYCFPNPRTGALGSVHRLQGEKSLNHHYAVFRVKLPSDLGIVKSP